MNLSRIVSTATLAILAALPVTARAADTDYPSRPITIVVPYAPGGQGDVMARLVGEQLGLVFKQPVIVENRPGASARLGTKRVTQSAPDGYTLLMGQTGEIAVNASVFSALEYDPQRDLQPIVLVANAPLVLAASSRSPYDSLPELLDAARREPGRITYASTGNATPGRLASAALAIGSGVQLMDVPYKSAGQVVTDLLGGHIDLFFISTSAFRPHYEGGTLKALAVASPDRVAALPQVPAIAQGVIPEFSYTLWAGLFAPAGTPQAIVSRLNQEVNRIMAQPALRQRVDADGSGVAANTPAEFSRFVDAEIRKYAILVKEAGIQVE